MRKRKFFGSLLARRYFPPALSHWFNIKTAAAPLFGLILIIYYVEVIRDKHIVVFDDAEDSMFFLSLMRQSWEERSSPAYYRPKVYSLAALHKCINFRRRETGSNRVVKVTLVGDSRVAMLRRHSKTLYGFQKKGDCANISLTDDSPLDHCTHEVMGIRGSGKHGGRLFHITLKQGDDYFEFQTWWKVYMDSSFRYKVEDLSVFCRNASDECPSLVVANSGIWYARRFDLTLNATAVDWILKYRRDLMDISVALQELAQLTKVVWKLDEPETVSRPGQSVSIETASVSVLHAYAYDILHGTSNLRIWSSTLPIALNFYHRVCMLAYRTHNSVMESTLRKECDDYHHVGYTVVSTYIQTIIDYLCQKYDESEINR